MKPLIAGNWKMHGLPDWYDFPAKFDALLPKSKRTGLDILMCPPSVLLEGLKQKARDKDISVGGQNCHEGVSGAHTGEISAEMLQAVGAEYVITGHSERRAAGETDSEVKAKSVAALRGGLIPIICVGESLAEREAGEAQSVVTRQLTQSVCETGEGEEIVIAYEPIWAIGTGKTATPDDIKDMHAHIRAHMGPNVRILYGGSVKPSNASEILATPNVNGALIGGASLKMESFADIAKSAL